MCDDYIHKIFFDRLFQNTRFKYYEANFLGNLTIPVNVLLDSGKFAKRLKERVLRLRELITEIALPYEPLRQLSKVLPF